MDANDNAPAGGGRVKKSPSRIIDTEEGQKKVDKFLNYLRRGNYIETACKASGLSRTWFYNTMDRARKGDPESREIAEQVEQAQAEAEANRVELIHIAARDDWRAAAWWLERVYRDRWGVDTKLIIEQKVDDQIKQFIQICQATLPPLEFKQLMSRLESTEEEREDLVSKEINEATDVKDAEIAIDDD